MAHDFGPGRWHGRLSGECGKVQARVKLSRGGGSAQRLARSGIARSGDWRVVSSAHAGGANPTPLRSCSRAGKFLLARWPSSRTWTWTWRTAPGLASSRGTAACKSATEYATPVTIFFYFFWFAWECSLCGLLLAFLFVSFGF